MQTFVAPTARTDLVPDGSAEELLSSVPAQPELEKEESVESLREALRTARLRVAYFERFGPWVEEQMAAVVERSATLERESELRREETAAEITARRAEVAEEIASLRRESERERQEIDSALVRRRQELAELTVDCERKRDEAAATIAQAHKTADFVMGKLNESASGIVDRALADFEALRGQLTPQALVAAAANQPPEEDPKDEPVLAENGSDETKQRGWFRR
jgi:hypothetical protein